LKLYLKISTLRSSYHLINLNFITSAATVSLVSHHAK